MPIVTGRKNIILERFKTKFIVICTEFPDNTRFQWRGVWTEERQKKFDCFVKSLYIGPEMQDLYPEDSAYWDPLRIADVVFVYASRTAIGKRISTGETWLWYELPKFVKKFLKPRTKLIIQFDDDLIFVFHPDWVWWNDRPSAGKSPKEFFDETKLLEIGDVYLTVLQDQPFRDYTSKPIKYLPLPQLNRYNSAMCWNSQKWATWKEKMHINRIGLMHHTSKVGSQDAIVNNVINKIGVPIAYFATWGSRQLESLPAGSIIYRMMNLDMYMETLWRECFIGIDDLEGYIGWSRFAMECAVSYIPCIGSTWAVKEFFPDLFVKHGDYVTILEKINQLINDKDYYREVAEKAFKLVNEKLDNDNLCKQFMDILNEINVPESSLTPEDIDEEMFIELLSSLLPHHLVPRRPVSSIDLVYDDGLQKLINQEQWDQRYKNYEKFINNEELYTSLIRETLDRRNQKRKSKLL